MKEFVHVTPELLQVFGGLVAALSLAALTSLITISMTIFLGEKALRRRVCRNATMKLRGYKSDLEFALRTLDKYQSALDSLRNANGDKDTIRLAAQSLNVVFATALPSAFWDNYKLSEDALGELFYIGRDDKTISNLPIDLKDIFDHSTKNWGTVIKTLRHLLQQNATNFPNSISAIDQEIITNIHAKIREILQSLNMAIPKLEKRTQFWKSLAT